MKQQQKYNLKTGDQVKVITGEKKGFLGKIKAIIKKKSSVIIEGILPKIKILKSTSINDETKTKELPILIHISNVMLWDSTIGKISRIGYRTTLNSENTKPIKLKQRYYKKSGNLVKD